MKPHRVQRKRTKGWRMPEDTVYVGRGTKWGNPFKINDMHSREDVVSIFEQMLLYGTDEQYPPNWEIIEELRGKNLACFCPLDKPCHADILLELANG